MNMSCDMSQSWESHLRTNRTAIHAISSADPADPADRELDSRSWEPQAPFVASRDPAIDDGMKVGFDRNMNSMIRMVVLGVVLFAVGCAAESTEDTSAGDQAISAGDTGSARQELMSAFPAVLVARRETTFYATKKSKMVGRSGGTYCDIYRDTGWSHDEIVREGTSYLIEKNSVSIGRDGKISAFLDRYVNGESVGSAQMRLVCTGSNGAVPTATNIQKAFESGALAGFLNWEFIPSTSRPSRDAL